MIVLTIIGVLVTALGLLLATRETAPSTKKDESQHHAV